MFIDPIDGGVWKTFTFRKVQINDIDLVVEFLSKHYLTNEPIHLALEESTEETIAFDREIFEVLLKLNLSFIALDTETSRVAAVLMNALYVKEFGRPFPLPPAGNRVGQFFTRIESEFNLFESYGVEQYGELYLVSVNPAFQGHGLGLEMARRSVELLKSIGVTVIMSLTASRYGDKILTDLGFETKQCWSYCAAANHGTSQLRQTEASGKVFLKILDS